MSNIKNKLIKLFILSQSLILSMNGYAINCDMLKNELVRIQAKQFALKEKPSSKHRLIDLERKRDRLVATYNIYDGIQKIKNEFATSAQSVKKTLTNYKDGKKTTGGNISSSQKEVNKLIDLQADLQSSIDSTAKVLLMDSFMSQLGTKYETAIDANDFLKKVETSCNGANNSSNPLCTGIKKSNIQEIIKGFYTAHKINTDNNDDVTIQSNEALVKKYKDNLLKNMPDTLVLQKYKNSAMDLKVAIKNEFDNKLKEIAIKNDIKNMGSPVKIRKDILSKAISNFENTLKDIIPAANKQKEMSLGKWELQKLLANEEEEERGITTPLGRRYIDSSNGLLANEQNIINHLNMFEENISGIYYNTAKELSKSEEKIRQDYNVSKKLKELRRNYIDELKNKSYEEVEKKSKKLFRIFKRKKIVHSDVAPTDLHVPEKEDENLPSLTMHMLGQILGQNPTLSNTCKFSNLTTSTIINETPFEGVSSATFEDDIEAEDIKKSSSYKDLQPKSFKKISHQKIGKINLPELKGCLDTLRAYKKINPSSLKSLSNEINDIEKEISDIRDGKNFKDLKIAKRSLAIILNDKSCEQYAFDNDESRQVSCRDKDVNQADNMVTLSYFVGDTKKIIAEFKASTKKSAEYKSSKLAAINNICYSNTIVEDIKNSMCKERVKNAKMAELREKYFFDVDEKGNPIKSTMKERTPTSGMMALAAVPALTQGLGLWGQYSANNYTTGYLKANAFAAKDIQSYNNFYTNIMMNNWSYKGYGSYPSFYNPLSTNFNYSNPYLYTMGSNFSTF